MSDSQQVHLAQLFSEHGGDMGGYTQCFIDFIKNTPEFDDYIKKTVTKPLSVSEPNFKSKRRRKVYRSKLAGERNHKGYFNWVSLKSSMAHEYHVKSKSLNIQLNNELLHSLSRMTELFFGDRFLDDLHKYRVRPHACIGEQHKKLTQTHFATASRELFRKGSTFIMDPGSILHEAVVTMKQSMTWACMWSETLDDVKIQMQAMLEPTITHPLTREAISPIQMLGFGNNGYIGEEISSRFPTHLNYRPIVRQATATDPSIINPNFVKLWFDRDLKIGGCPAQVHKRRIGDVYMNFAQMYVDCAIKITDRWEQFQKLEQSALQENTSAPAND